jgi:hypothetical protein
MSSSRTTMFLAALFTGLLSLNLVNCSPILTSAQPMSPAEWSALVKRSPISASAMDAWPTNVIMLGGSETYGMWVPQDGEWHDVGDIMCLDVPAYNIVNCGSVTIDNVGVVEGYGPCTFIGSTGWSASVSGASGAGYKTVGPPQTISQVWCAT